MCLHWAVPWILGTIILYKVLKKIQSITAERALSYWIVLQMQKQRPSYIKRFALGRMCQVSSRPSRVQF